MPRRGDGFRRRGAGSSSAEIMPRARRGLRFVDHFINGGTSNDLLVISASGGAATIVAGQRHHPGVVSLSTSTSATGNARAISGLNFLAGPHSSDNATTWQAYVEIMLRIATLSDGTETFSVRAGFGDVANADHADGPYFELNSSADTSWHIKSASNTVRSDTDTGVAYTANTWRRVGVLWQPGLATFYEGDGEVSGHTGTLIEDGAAAIGSLSTNLIDDSRQTGIVVSILKSAGTTARTLEVDYVELDYYFAA